ncbi:hypothetical protein MSAN_01880000 [Mycena sanguinolenta]|uniref:Uncharacterized protein n=1 Tax=Mycena sanguinolenta TaxID=230812 RepID=A0A8H6XU67_9AGAR|nr:hypothetical protein MSAN_01880000 [Mycena sanguinolenta]
MVDLKQVGKLFNDTIAAIRDDTPDLDALEPQALEWLRGARYKLMRDLEQVFYDLEKARNTPLSQPPWAVNPAEKLVIMTKKVPAVLEPYRLAMSENLNNLLNDCGFQSHFSGYAKLGSEIFLRIQFPAQLSTGAPQASRTLQVEDEFSGHPGGGGAFAAGKFGRLITDARVGAGTSADSEPDSSAL